MADFFTSYRFGDTLDGIRPLCLEGGKLTMVAARTGHCKTKFLQNLALQVAQTEGEGRGGEGSDAQQREAAYRFGNRTMTHEERVWELYKGFVFGAFNHYCQIPTDEDADLSEEGKEYLRMAETFATAFEMLSAEESERTITDTPFENRAPDFKVTAMEG